MAKHYRYFNIKYLLLLVFIAVYESKASAQLLEGRWEGNFSKNILSGYVEKLVVDLHMTDDTVLSGTSHLYYENDKYEHYRVRGYYHPADSTVYIKEDSTIAVKLGFMADNCLGNYTMKLKITDSFLHMEGKWRDNSSQIFGCPTTKAWLDKQLKHKADTVKPKKRDKNIDRAYDVQSLIELSEEEKDNIKIELSDNAEVDGDVVSVYVNDVLVVDKHKLLAEPEAIFVSVNKDNPISRVVMVAESEGVLPPCTARMVVTTARKVYKMDLSSDSRKSGAIELFLKGQ